MAGDDQRAFWQRTLTSRRREGQPDRTETTEQHGLWTALTSYRPCPVCALSPFIDDEIATQLGVSNCAGLHGLSGKLQTDSARCIVIDQFSKEKSVWTRLETALSR
jgi:hypothetical protein